MSEFADKKLLVVGGPLEGRRWSTDYAPYQRGILDVFHDPEIIECVVMGSSQWGKTSVCCVMVAYHIEHEPCPILMIEPTLELADEFSEDRINELIQKTPVLRDLMTGRQTIRHKSFPGGSLSMGGANAPTQLAARSIRVLLLDEIDRYPLTLAREGSTIEIARKRTQVYKKRKKIMLTSSPTIKGAPIDQRFELGDKRRFFVPCPRCGHMHTLQWKNIKWENRDPETARFVCPSCDYEIHEPERMGMVAGGKWRATNSDRMDKSIASFHMWEGYSPFSSLQEIVKSFLSAKKMQREGDSSPMHTWVNTTLGEPRAVVEGEGVDPLSLQMRREVYGTQEAEDRGERVDVPMEAAFLSAGVDVQDDRLEILVVAWGKGEESWIVDRQTFLGRYVAG